MRERVRFLNKHYHLFDDQTLFINKQTELSINFITTIIELFKLKHMSRKLLTVLYSLKKKFDAKEREKNNQWQMTHGRGRVKIEKKLTRSRWL